MLHRNDIMNCRLHHWLQTLSSNPSYWFAWAGYLALPLICGMLGPSRVFP